MSPEKCTVNNTYWHFGNVIALAVVGVVAQTNIVSAADHAFCVRYADGAVAQYRELTKLKCADPNKPARWSENWQGHYGWCRSARESSSNSETRARADAISECKRCHSFAGGAVASQQANIKLGCGLTGSRWSLDFEHHRRWCLRARRSSQEAEDRNRARQLDACRRASAPQSTPVLPVINVVRDAANNFAIRCVSGFARSAPLTILVTDATLQADSILQGGLITHIGGQRLTTDAAGGCQVSLFGLCRQRGDMYFQASDGRRNPRDFAGNVLWSERFRSVCM
jgi:hypothetical protein